MQLYHARGSHCATACVRKGSVLLATSFSTASAGLFRAPTQRLFRWRRLAISNVDGPNVVTDDSVPEGHRGLHSALYGTGDQHATGPSSYEFRQGEDDGSVLIPVPQYLQYREGEKPLGVYGVFDSKRHLQYVSYSRNIVLAVKGHLRRVGEERCAFVRPMVFANRSMATRAALEQQVDAWLAESGTIPPGNGVEQQQWEGLPASVGVGVNVDALSEDERAAYEDKKLKLRMAMGENLYAEDQAPGGVQDEQRRLNLKSAMEADDWSAVIEGQAQDTLPANDTNAAPTAATAKPIMATPFSRADVHRSLGSMASRDAEEMPVLMTVETVDRALDEVRPYLQADGGDVEVVGVDNGIVVLRLNGACGTCSASQATMAMGIEHQLRAVFGDQLQQVLEVGQMDRDAPTIVSVNEHLNLLRPAVLGLGGKVEVVEVDGHTATLRYQGPRPIGAGLQAAIKDRFPTIREVLLLSFVE